MLQFLSANFCPLAARDFSFGAEETAGPAPKQTVHLMSSAHKKVQDVWNTETETQHDSNFSNPMATHGMDFLLQMMRDHREPADNLDIENR